MRPALGVLCALGAALGWTLIGLCARMLAPYLNALSINMVRSAGGGALLLVVAVVTGGLGALAAVPSWAWAYLAISVVTAFAIGDTAFFEASRLLGLGRAMTVSMAYPLMAGTAGVLVFGEPLTGTIVLGALVTLGGLAVIIGEGTGQAPTQTGRRGVGLALLAAVSWAVSTVLMKVPLDHVDPVSVQTVRLPLAAALMGLTPWARGTGRQIRAHLRAVAPALLALIVLTAVSAVTFVAGLKYAGVTLATILSSTSPLFALPIGLVAFQEAVTWREAAGAALTVAGIALLSL